MPQSCTLADWTTTSDAAYTSSTNDLDLIGPWCKSEEMVRQIRCECGYVARGATDDDVIALTQSHVAADHPDLTESHTADYLRDWIELLPE